MLVQRLRERKTGQLIPARDCWMGLPDYDLVMAEPGVEYMGEDELLRARLQAQGVVQAPMPEVTLPGLKETRSRRRGVQDVVASQPEDDLLAGLINGTDG